MGIVNCSQELQRFSSTNYRRVGLRMNISKGVCLSFTFMWGISCFTHSTHTNGTVLPSSLPLPLPLHTHTRNKHTARAPIFLFLFNHCCFTVSDCRKWRVHDGLRRWLACRCAVRYARINRRAGRHYQLQQGPQAGGGGVLPLHSRLDLMGVPAFWSHPRGYLST